MPGLNYLPYSPRALSTLPLIAHLERAFDVTAVFRRVLSHEGLEGLRYLEIDPGDPPSRATPQHATSYYHPRGARGQHYTDFRLAEFARYHAARFDVVVEREWACLGALGDAFQLHGVPAILHTVAEFRPEARRRLGRRPWRMIAAWREDRRRLRHRAHALGAHGRSARGW